MLQTALWLGVWIPAFAGMTNQAGWQGAGTLGKNCFAKRSQFLIAPLSSPRRRESWDLQSIGNNGV